MEESPSFVSDKSAIDPIVGDLVARMAEIHGSYALGKSPRIYRFNTGQIGVVLSKQSFPGDSKVPTYEVLWSSGKPAGSVTTCFSLADSSTMVGFGQRRPKTFIHPMEKPETVENKGGHSSCTKRL